MFGFLFVTAMVLGCGDDDAAKQDQAAVVRAPVAPAPKEPSAEEKFADARTKALGGDHLYALHVAETVLGDLAADDSIWRFLEHQAIATGKARDVLDKLDATEAVGGRTEQHQMLRGMMALESGDFTTVEAVADAIEETAPDDATVLRALAARKAETVDTPDAPSEEDTVLTPAAAMMGFAKSQSWEDAAQFEEAAAKVGGWRANLLRAEILEQHEQQASALASYGTLVAEEDPRAKLAGYLAQSRIAFASDPIMGEGDTSSWDDGLAAFREALAVGKSEGSLFNCAEQGLIIAERLRSQGRVEDATGLLRELWAPLQDAEHPAPDASVKVGLQFSESALNAGLAKEAFDTLDALSGLSLSGDVADDVAWTKGWAAHGLGRPDAVAEAAKTLTGSRGTAIRALAALDFGVLGVPFPASGLDAEDQARVSLVAAQVNPFDSITLLESAVELSEGAPLLRLEALLALEGALRSQERPTGPVLERLSSLAPEGTAGDAMRQEVAARALLVGDQSRTDSLLAGAGNDGPGVAWSALAQGRQVPDEASHPFAKSLAGWAQARSMAKNGEPGVDVHYASGLGTLPLHRVGALSLGTVLDGSQGIGLDADIALLSMTKGDDTIGSILLAHELGHRKASVADDAMNGRQFLAGVDQAKREAVVGAVTRARALNLLALAGGPALSVDAINAVKDAETAAGEGTGFGKALPSAGLSAEQVRERLQGAAVLSYRFSNGRVTGVVLTPNGGEFRDLGSSEDVTNWSREHAASLKDADPLEAKSDHRAGHKLRQALIDPFIGALTGYGRYLVVAPHPLLAFPFTSFPEQSAGLRWLADIRTISSSPSLASLRIYDTEDLAYNPDFLGFSAPKMVEPKPEPAPKEEADAKSKKDGKAADGKAKVDASKDDAKEGEDGKAGAGEAAEGAEADKEKTEPPAEPEEEEVVANKTKVTDRDLLERKSAGSIPRDLTSGSRHFSPDFRTLLSGQQVTLDAWRTRAPKARYIYLADIPATQGAGFKLGDGVLSLSEIRAVPLQAELVVITAQADAGDQLSRAKALLDAGAGAVLVSAWDIPSAAQEKFIDGFFEGLNRDRPPARAVGEARQVMLRNTLLDEDLDDPALWGAMILFAHP